MKMLPKHISFLLLLIIAVSCQNKDSATNNAELINLESSEVERLETQLGQAKSEVEGKEIAHKLEKELVIYATKHKTDSIAPKYLYKAARLNETYFENYTEAFGHYNSIAEEYPSTRFAPVAMFKRGLIMETVFKKSDKAIYYLDEFIKKHPDHKLVEMAVQIISTSGVDANELFERIKSKQIDSTIINH